MTGNGYRDSMEMGKGSRNGGSEAKGIRVCDANTPVPYAKGVHCILQTYTKDLFNLKILILFLYIGNENMTPKFKVQQNL